MSYPNEQQRAAFELSRKTAADSLRCFLAGLAYLGMPESLLDVGCGPGHLVRAAAALGIPATGVDISAGTRSATIAGLDEQGTPVKIFTWDLCWPVVPGLLRTTYGMVLCLEVAEHLPPEAAPVLCDSLVAALAPGGVLLFSAAIPGQGGAGHLNEQSHEYWTDQLTRRGLSEVHESTRHLRQLWTQIAPRSWWYGQNVTVYRKAGKQA